MASSRHRSPRQPRGRKKMVASALADLASRRRATKRNSCRLSRSASLSLHHGDTSDGESFAGYSARDTDRRRSAEGAGYERQATYEEEGGDDETATYVSHTFEARFEDERSFDGAAFEDDGSFEATFEEETEESFEDSFEDESAYAEEESLSQQQLQRAPSRSARSIFSLDADLDEVMAHIESSNSVKVAAATISLAEEEEDEEEAQALPEYIDHRAGKMYAPTPYGFDECPDDESPPRMERKLYDDMGTPVSPLTPTDEDFDYNRNRYAGEGLHPAEKDLEVAEEEDDGVDESAKAGNEALLFVCGHNANLYRLFDLPLGAHKLDIDEAHDEQLEQLDLAAEIMACDNAEAQRQAAVLVGMKKHHGLGGLSPRDFVEIKRDAVRRAYDILTGEESRVEYDELLQEFSFEERTAATAPETASPVASSVGGYAGTGDEGADFWSEANCSPDADEGVNFAQRDCVAGEEGEEEEAVEQNGLHYQDRDGFHYEGTEEEADAESRLDYEYHSEDEYGEEEEEEEYDEEEYDDQEGEYEDDYASIVEVIKSKGRLDAHTSPTDVIEFDELIQDSLPDKQFFDQLSPEARRKWYYHGYPKMEEEQFDPFDLRGGQVLAPSVNSHSFVEAEIQPAESVESVSFICKLPTRDEDDEDDDELTMGDLIEKERSMAEDASQQDLPLDADSYSVSTFDSMSLASSTQGSARSKKGKFKSKVRSMVASVSGRNRAIDPSGSLASEMKNDILIPVKEERSGWDPDGPNMSDGVADDCGEEEDNGGIDTFASARSNHESAKVEGILRQSSLQCDETSMCSARTNSSVKSIYKGPRPPKVTEDADAIDCFPAEEEEGRKVRFNINNGDDEYEYLATASVVSGASGVSGESSRHRGEASYADELFEEIGSTVDDAVGAVEHFFGTLK
ncbi:hypothetical protein ACHAXT_007279 [Thalassiosira profunda]